MNQRFITATVAIKITVPYKIVAKKSMIYPADIAEYKQKQIILAHVKQHVEIASGVIKSCSATLNIKNIRNYQEQV